MSRDINKKLLVLPVEVKNREYLAKLYLAILAAKKGYQVALGCHDEKVMLDFKNAILLYKDHAVVTEARLSRQLVNDNKVYSLDEEGLIYISKEMYIKTRVSAKWAEKATRIFCWGELQKGIINGVMSSAKCKEVGNPRLDLLHYLRRRRVESKGGRLKILVNTRFASINSGFTREEFLRRLERLGVIKTSADREVFKRHQEDDEVIFSEFKEAVESMAADPGLEVIVRPHPAESLEVYKKIFRKNNVVVDNSEELVRQLDWADIVIHDGCTTAIEASLSGAFVVGLRPGTVRYTYGEFANAFSDVATRSYVELLAVLDKAKEEIAGLKRKNISEIEFLGEKEKIQNLIRSWDYPCAAEMILEEFFLEEISLQKLVVKRIFFKEKAKNIFYRFIKKTRLSFLFSLLGKRFKSFLDDKDISFSKFPRLAEQDVKEDILYICDLVGVDGRDIKVDYLTERSFLIYT